MSLQPVLKVWLHSTSDASPPAALLLLQILPVFSVVAPCRRGASLVSVRRQTFTTGCYGTAKAAAYVRECPMRGAYVSAGLPVSEARYSSAAVTPPRVKGTPDAPI